jgi:hypothetical protein
MSEINVKPFTQLGVGVSGIGRVEMNVSEGINILGDGVGSSVLLEEQLLKANNRKTNMNMKVFVVESFLRTSMFMWECLRVRNVKLRLDLCG